MVLSVYLPKVIAKISHLNFRFKLNSFVVSIHNHCHKSLVINHF